MNRTTALRAYGKPSYCPAKGIRIRNDSYYLVRMQNVESDSNTDYHGLADGEYTELVTGKEARSRRDSRLNHCNAITVHRTPVYRVVETQFGIETGFGEWTREPYLFSDERDAVSCVAMLTARAEERRARLQRNPEATAHSVKNVREGAIYYLKRASEKDGSDIVKAAVLRAAALMASEWTPDQVQTTAYYIRVQ